MQTGMRREMKASQRCSIPAGSDLRALLPKPARADSIPGPGPIVSAGGEPRESFVVMPGGETPRDGAGDAQPFWDAAGFATWPMSSKSEAQNVSHPLRTPVCAQGNGGERGALCPGAAEGTAGSTSRLPGRGRGLSVRFWYLNSGNGPEMCPEGGRDRSLLSLSCCYPGSEEGGLLVRAVGCLPPGVPAVEGKVFPWLQPSAEPIPRAVSSPRGEPGAGEGPSISCRPEAPLPPGQPQTFPLLVSLPACGGGAGHISRQCSALGFLLFFFSHCMERSPSPSGQEGEGFAGAEHRGCWLSTRATGAARGALSTAWGEGC